VPGAAPAVLAAALGKKAAAVWRQKLHQLATYAARLRTLRDCWLRDIDIAARLSATPRISDAARLRYGETNQEKVACAAGGRYIAATCR